MLGFVWKFRAAFFGGLFDNLVCFAILTILYFEPNRSPLLTALWLQFAYAKNPDPAEFTQKAVLASLRFTGLL